MTRLMMESALQNPTFEKARQNGTGTLASEMEVALLTGGMDRPYAFGLSLALASKGVTLDVLGATELDSPELHAFSNLNFFATYGDQRRRVGVRRKTLTVPGFLRTDHSLRGHGEAEDFPYTLELQVPTLRSNSAHAVLQGPGKEGRLHRP